METSSAGRRRQQTKPPLGWVLGGLGLLLALASLYFQFGGGMVWHGRLKQEAGAASATSFSTPSIELEKGSYSFRLSYRQPRKLIQIGPGYHRVRISAEDLPVWTARGSVKAQKKRKRSGGSVTIRGDVFATLPSPVRGIFQIEIDGAKDASVDLSIHRASLNYRVLLWPGLILLGLALVLDASFRSKLLGLLERIPGFDRK